MTSSFLNINVSNALMVLLDASIRCVLLFALAGAVNLLLRNRSAALRHGVWTTAVVLALLLPVLSAVLPSWRLGVLPDVAVVTTSRDTKYPSAPTEPPLSSRDAAPQLDSSPVESSAITVTRQDTADSNETLEEVTHASSANPTVAAESGSDPVAVESVQEQTASAAEAEVAVRQTTPQNATETASGKKADKPSFMTVLGRINISTWIVLTWILGVAVMVASMLIGTIGIRRVAGKSRHITDPAILSMKDQLCESLAIRQPVLMLQSDESFVPVTWGIWWPTVLLPREAKDWTPSRLRMVLLHELAHIKRGDCLTQLWVQLARALYWFHPLVWWAACNLRIQRERACDDFVLAGGIAGPDYADQLLQIVRSLRSGKGTPLAAVAMARKSQFESRLLSVLDNSRRRGGLSRKVAWAILAVALAVALPLAALQPVARAKPASSEDRPSKTQHVKKPSKPQVLYYAGDKPTGKMSYAGSSPAVRFERSDASNQVYQVKICASRYGRPQAPKENFKLFLLNEDANVLGTFEFPYSMIQRTGDQKWYTLKIKPTVVPEVFYVAVEFNAERTKGVYVGLDEKGEAEHTYLYSVDEEKCNKLDGKGAWMIRAYLRGRGSEDSLAKAGEARKKKILEKEKANVVPAGSEVLSYAGDKNTGKMSYGGGRGPAVQFERSDAVNRLVQVKLYASRYGLSQPPKEDFKLFLMDKNGKLLKTFKFPYGMIKRTGDLKWYTLKVKPTAVPKEFYLALFFNAHQRKGIYVGLDDKGDADHSYLYFTDSRECKKLDGKGAWMIRAVLKDKSDVPADETADIKKQEPATPGGDTVGKVVNDVVTDISTMADGDPRIPELLESLKALDEQAVVRELKKYFDSKRNTIRRAAIYVFWKAKFSDPSPAIPGLIRLCSHKEEYTRGMAALALGEMKAKGSFDALVEMAEKDQSAFARRCAVYALGTLGNPKAKPILQNALKDPNAMVRNNAEAALTLLSKAKATDEGKSSGKQMRYFVLLVAGTDKMTFEGKDVTWEQLPALLEKIHNRKQTVFEVAVASGDMTVASKQAFMSKAHKLAKKYDFEYLSDTGIKPLGSKGDATQVVKRTKLPPYVPSTSRLQLVDKMDYPFVNDPDVLGRWESVDFVSDMNDFDPGKKKAGGTLLLQELVFHRNGKTQKTFFTWTKGLLFHSGDKTASRYTIRKINGTEYMFLEWKSGDYAIRLSKPKYYVLRKTVDSGSDRTADAVPYVISTSPVTFANDVDPRLDKISVTFDQPMMDQSWSWTGGGDTYPKTTGRPSYDDSKKTCTLPVKLEPGKVYWVGINSPSHKNFKTPSRKPVKWYVILFATKSAGGKPTPIPKDMLNKAKRINGNRKVQKGREPADSTVPETPSRKLLDDQTRKDVAKCDRMFAGWFQPNSRYEMASDARKALMVKKWIQEAQSDDFKKRTAAIAMLGNVKAKQAVDVLIQIAEEPMNNCRPKWLAVRALGEIGDIKAVPTLIGLVDFGNWNTRIYARASLAEITGVYFGDDKEKWIQWWKENAPKDVEESSSSKGTTATIGMNPNSPKFVVAISDNPQEEIEGLKQLLIKWVEDFFSKNYRDITARKTLEWGDPETAANGNLSIRYKFLATIWHKEKKIIEKRFTFTPKGKFVSAETIEQGPAGKASSPVAADVMTYIHGVHMATYPKAHAKGLANTNTHIYVVDDQLRVQNGGLMTYWNQSNEEVTGPIRLGNFGKEKPDFILFDEQNDEQKYSLQEHKKKNLPRFSLWWKPVKPVQPAAMRTLGYFNRQLRPLRVSGDKAMLTMQNFYGSPVLENFFLVLPKGVTLDSSDIKPTSNATVGDYQVILWQREISAKTNNKVQAILVKTDTSTSVSDADKRKAENVSAQGWKLWQQRKLTEAEELFQQAVKLDPANTNAWNGLGWSQFNQGKPINAKEAFEKCIALEPKHAAALNGLGWIAKGQKKTKEAIEYWKKAVEAAPTATAALNGLTQTYMEQKKYDDAIKYYEMWLKAEPNNADAKKGLKKARNAAKANSVGENKEEAASIQSATKAAERWLKVIDAGEYGKAWDTASPGLQKLVTKDDWVRVMKAVQQGFAAKSRRLEIKQEVESMPGLPHGPFIVLRYDTQLESKRIWENVVLRKEASDAWQVIGFTIAPHDDGVGKTEKKPQAIKTAGKGNADPGWELAPNVEFPRKDDAIYSPENCRIGPSDVLTISIRDLYKEGIETTLLREVSHGGFIDLPLLKARLNVGGMTEEQVTETIVKAYGAAKIIANAIVSVKVAASRYPKTFSALGAVAKPGSCRITRPDMRLLEALAKVGGITQAKLRYLYVIRSAPDAAKQDPKDGKQSSGPRIIAIDLPKLRTGDFRMNIIIRDKDIIQVPMGSASDMWDFRKIVTTLQTAPAGLVEAYNNKDWKKVNRLADDISDAAHRLSYSLDADLLRAKVERGAGSSDGRDVEYLLKAEKVKRDADAFWGSKTRDVKFRRLLELAYRLGDQVHDLARDEKYDQLPAQYKELKKVLDELDCLYLHNAIELSQVNKEDAQAIRTATKTVEQWLKVIDAGEYAKSWDEMAKLSRKAVTKKQWVKDASMLKTFGPVKSRKLISADYTTTLPGAPDGQYVILKYKTTFENKKDATETITPMKDKDGTWRVSGYYVK